MLGEVEGTHLGKVDVGSPGALPESLITKKIDFLNGYKKIQGEAERWLSS